MRNLEQPDERGDEPISGRERPQVPAPIADPVPKPIGSSPNVRVDGGSSHMVALAPGDLSRARRHEIAGTPKRDFEAVSGSDFPGRLKVHPHLGEVPTIAILPETVPAGTTFVSAGCKTVRPEASLIEYAMAIVPRDGAPEAAFDVRHDAPDGFSGWHSFRPMEPGRIHLVLDVPASGDERLCFATRLPPGSSEENAWATWSGVVFGIGWRPKTGRSIRRWSCPRHLRIRRSRPSSIIDLWRPQRSKEPRRVEPKNVRQLNSGEEQ